MQDFIMGDVSEEELTEIPCGIIIGLNCSLVGLLLVLQCIQLDTGAPMTYKERLTGIELAETAYIWHRFQRLRLTHYLLKFPVRIFLGHWEFPQLVASQSDWWQV